METSPANTPKLALTAAERTVLAFTLGYLALAAAASFGRDNLEFLIYIGVIVVLLAVVAAVHFRVRLHIAALWGLSVWGLAHMAGGLMPVPAAWPRPDGDSAVLYNLWLVPGRLKYDQLVHAGGFGLVTWICWQALARAFELAGARVRPTAGLLTLCVAGGMGFGALNEVIEFLATLVLPETNVGGYANTGFDLVFNFLGAVTAAVLIALGDGRAPARRSD